MINDTKYDIPGINWLVHVLAENVGRNEWVKMTPDELEAYKLTLPEDMRKGAYTMKVITHPIPNIPGVIKLECSKEYVAAFNTDRAKQLFIQLAQRYQEMEREYWRAMGEMGAEKWQECREDNTPCSIANHGIGHEGLCSAGHHSCIVTSPALAYVHGISHACYSCNGGGSDHKRRTYYIKLNGKYVEVKPTHWRPIPPGPAGNHVKYEDVKDEVERIKREAGLEE